MSSPEADVYAALGRAFASAGLRWYLFGGQAAILHGALRFTEDVDVTVDVGDRATGEIVEALGKHGVELRVTVDVDDFVAATRVLPLVHAATGIPVDVVLAGPGLEDVFFERVTPTTIDGVLVPVAAPEDLVVMKVLAARAKDIEDVVSILVARRENFDMARVRELLALLEAALDQSDLLPALDACVARAERARARG